MNDDRDALERYFRESDVEQEHLRAGKATDSRVRLLTKNLVPVRFRGTARLLLTDFLAPVERRKAQAVAAEGRALRLHLGSGGEHKSGWVNVDLVGDPVEIAWDLARGIPFGDQSAEAIFHEHLLEHIPLRAGLGLMAECHRVLRPGGILRVVVPDAGALVESYVGDGTYIEANHPGRPTRMLALQELFYWHRHTTMFDAETLALVFRASGFQNPRQCKFGMSDLDETPDTARRAAESLYMEAQRS